MSAFEELQNKKREDRSAIEQCIMDAARLEDLHDGDIKIMEKAADELAQLMRNSAFIVCAYCGHETPRADKSALLNHIFTCDKRPEATLMKKAFEIEDALYQRIIHLTTHAFEPMSCGTCQEIYKTLAVYWEGFEQKEQPNEAQ